MSAKVVISYSCASCDLGFVLLAEDAQGVCAVFFADQQERLVDELQQSFPAALLRLEPIKLEQSLRTLLQFIENPQPQLPFALSMHGTAFQQEVWQQLQRIPLGSTVDYGAIAAQINRPKAYRAVASACASNKLAFLVPCHRVIRKNGELADYRWGLWRKQALLANERKLLAKCTIAK